jgi:hypothetical protein
MPGYLYDPVPLLERTQRSILRWCRQSGDLEDARRRVADRIAGGVIPVRLAIAPLK